MVPIMEESKHRWKKLNTQILPKRKKLGEGGYNNNDSKSNIHLSALHLHISFYSRNRTHINSFIFPQCCELGKVIMSILHNRKLSHKEVK